MAARTIAEKHGSFVAKLPDKKNGRGRAILVSRDFGRSWLEGAQTEESRSWIDLLKTNWTNVNSIYNNISQTISRHNNSSANIFLGLPKFSHKSFHRLGYTYLMLWHHHLSGACAWYSDFVCLKYRICWLPAYHVYTDISRDM